MDRTDDHAVRGAFGDQAGGVLEPKLLKSLPKNAPQLVDAVSANVRESVEGVSRRPSAWPCLPGR